MKPVIGLTSYKNYDCEDRDYYSQVKHVYVEAIIKSGGVPIVIPENSMVKEYIDIIDGLLLTGGSDIDPLLYGEDPIKDLGRVDRGRDNFEISIYEEAFKNHLPVLSICRGMQLINIYHGGSLYQDIFSQTDTKIGHVCPLNLNRPRHEIEIIKDTKLKSQLGKDKALVNSLHHQAIKKLADDFIVSARSNDGIIEAIEYSKSDRYIQGTQFHPEELVDSLNGFINIFKDFIKEARKVKENRK